MGRKEESAYSYLQSALRTFEENTMSTFHEKILDEFHNNAKRVFKKTSENTLDRICSFILESKKIYVLGIGHSGMFGRILAMKLNHVGLCAYSVFDEINPPFNKNDLFIAISQSGETDTLISLARKAKKLGGKVMVITTNTGSTLAGLSDIIFEIKDVAEDMVFTTLTALGGKEHQNLLGCLFGFNIYVLFYAVVLKIAEKRGETADSIDNRHANLQ
jgi:6-phospho-3-hexuloisomerase